MDAQDLLQSAHFVDQTVETLGIASPRLAELDLSSPHAQSIVQAFFSTNQRMLEMVPRLEGLQDSLARSQDDTKLMRSARDHLKNELQRAKQDINMTAEHLRQAEIRTSKLTDQLRQSKEEARRLKLEKQHLATQYDHFKKRKEREYDKLKERLEKLLTDKNNERKLGMTALNKIQSKDGKRGQWANATRADDDMNRMIVQTYEDRIKEATLENSELRESLASVECDLVAMLNGAPWNTPRGLDAGSPDRPRADTLTQQAAKAMSPKLTTSTGNSPSRPGTFELPFSASRTGIERSLKSKMANLKDRVTQLNIQATASGTANHTTVEELEGKIAELTTIIQKQQQALFEDSGTPSPSKSFLSDSILHEQADALRREKALLEDKLENINGEREMFLKAARKLDRDRAKIEAAKVQLPMTPILSGTPSEEQRTKRGSSLAHALLRSSILPPTPSAFASTPSSVTTTSIAADQNLGSQSTPTGAIDLSRYLQMDATPKSEL